MQQILKLCFFVDRKRRDSLLPVGHSSNPICHAFLISRLLPCRGIRILRGASVPFTDRLRSRVETRCAHTRCCYAERELTLGEYRSARVCTPRIARNSRALGSLIAGGLPVRNNSSGARARGRDSQFRACVTDRATTLCISRSETRPVENGLRPYTHDGSTNDRAAAERLAEIATRARYVR